LEKEIREGISCRISESKYRQILTLLTDNALKYCDEGGEIKTVLEKAGRGFRFSISNTYAAGADVDYNRFFERFYREDSSHSEKGGYGVGLSVADSLAKQLKGELSVQWEKGVIKFSLYLGKR
ncbi:MAG: ATP-binding protein, partial [Lachnospiraceae bacterium]|nr:ATP-binding protein [Lachnospiraceae bacterium]